jgi:hypothetical protein
MSTTLVKLSVILFSPCTKKAQSVSRLDHECFLSNPFQTHHGSIILPSTSYTTDTSSVLKYNVIQLIPYAYIKFEFYFVFSEQSSCQKLPHGVNIFFLKFFKLFIQEIVNVSGKEYRRKRNKHIQSRTLSQIDSPYLHTDRKSHIKGVWTECSFKFTFIAHRCSFLIWYIAVGTEKFNSLQILKPVLTIKETTCFCPNTDFLFDGAEVNCESLNQEKYLSNS